MHKVHYNRSMLLAAVLPLLLIMVSCLYLLMDGAAKARQSFLFGVLHSPYFFYPILTVIFIAFAQYATAPMGKLLRKKPALRWGSAGITLANGSRVAWAAITDIQLHQKRHQTHILIFLDHPLAFMDMQCHERHTTAHAHWKRFQTPIAIHCQELDIDAQVLLEALQSQHHQYHHCASK